MKAGWNIEKLLFPIFMIGGYGLRSTVRIKIRAVSLEMTSQYLFSSYPLNCLPVFLKSTLRGVDQA
jgi:hypothetical protein